MNLLQALYAVNDFLDQGGFALYVIAVAALLLWALIMERLLYIHCFSAKTRSRLAAEWRQFSAHRDADKIKNAYKHAFRQQLVTNLAMIKLLITLAPMFGLFGTVYGMIEIFDVISQSGTGDARAMANGISMATLSTMAGMAVAISGLFIHHRLEASAERKAVAFSDMLTGTEDEKNT